MGVEIAFSRLKGCYVDQLISGYEKVKFIKIHMDSELETPQEQYGD